MIFVEISLKNMHKRFKKISIKIFEEYGQFFEFLRKNLEKYV
jgi:hypothetical protein